MNKKSFVLLLSSLFIVSGCVSKGKVTTLPAPYDPTSDPTSVTPPASAEVQLGYDALKMNGVTKARLTLSMSSYGFTDYYTTVMEEINHISINSIERAENNEEAQVLIIEKEDYKSYVENKGETFNETAFLALMSQIGEHYVIKQEENDVYTFVNQMSEKEYCKFDKANKVCYYAEEENGQQPGEGDFYIDTFSDDETNEYALCPFDFDLLTIDKISYNEKDKQYIVEDDAVFGLVPDLFDNINFKETYQTEYVFFELDSSNRLSKYYGAIKTSDGDSFETVAYEMVIDYPDEVDATFPSSYLDDLCKHTNGSYEDYNGRYHYQVCNDCHNVIPGTVEEHSFNPNTHLCSCEENEEENIVILSRNIFGKETNDLTFQRDLSTNEINSWMAFNFREDFQTYDYVLLPGDSSYHEASFNNDLITFYGHGKKTFVEIKVNNDSVAYFPSQYTLEQREVNQVQCVVLVVTETYHDPIK